MMAENLKMDACMRVLKVSGRVGDSFIPPTVQRERIEAWAQLWSARLPSGAQGRPCGRDDTR
jgi:hypothetical protein